MSKISLSLNGDRAFGKYFPSVFINTVAVRHREIDPDGTDGPKSGNDTIIDVTLNINLTKDKELNDPSEYIEKYLGDLCLYGWLNTMPILNEDITQRKLHLKDLFQLYSAESISTVTDFDSSHPAYDILINQMKQAFASKAHYTLLNDGSMPADGLGGYYTDASESDILAALEDPETVWYYLFYGMQGADGPWGDEPEGAFYAGGNLEASKSLKLWASSTTKTTWNFESLQSGDYSNLWRSWMEWHGFAYISFYTGSHVHDTAGVTELTYKIPLKDLLIKSDLDSDTSTPEANLYGADLWIQNVYDEEGNELIQINGIKMSFAYHDDSYATTRLDKANVYFIGTIGLDIDRIDDDERTTRSVDEFLYDSPRSLFNNYFGNISYEHILENNIVPTQYIELWEYASNNEPYDDIPIQNLNGWFYETTPVGQTQIVDSFNSLINHYSNRAEHSRELTLNLQKLSALLNLHSTDVTLLTQLSIYRQTYFPRTPDTPSGWFYRDFLSVLASLVTRIGVQERVLKRMARVGIVTDYRASIGGWYVAPHPSGPVTEDGSLTWLAFNRDGDDFIPTLWAEMARQSFLMDTVSSGSTKFGTNYPTDFEELYLDILESLSGRAEMWKDQGFTDAQIETWARTAAYLAYHRGIVDSGGPADTIDWWDIDGSTSMGATLSDLYWPEKMSNDPSMHGGGSMSTALHQDVWLKTGYMGTIATWLNNDMVVDTIVMNRGTWWFDWEKALYTQSKIAHVIRLNLLGRFLRMRIPYKYFHVTEVMMKRVEIDLNADGGTSGVGDFNIPAGGLPGKRNTTEIRTALADPGSGLGSWAYPKNGTCYMFNSSGEDNLGYFIPEATIIENRFDNLEEDQQTDLFDETVTTRTENSWLAFVPADAAVDPSSYLGDEAYVGSGGDDSLVNQTLAFYGYAAPDAGKVYLTGSAAPDGDGYYYDVSTLPMDTALNQGLRVRNGYRLMCFEYQDMMDDDIAYYNTLFKEDSARLDALKIVNDGFPTTTYQLQVKVEDTTLSWYAEIFYPWIEEQYEHFSEYYAYAEEFCTYNNITHQFNQFFVDAMNEKYPTGDRKLWVRSAMLSVMLREILFQTVGTEAWSSGGMTEAEFREKLETDVLDIVKTISPEEGNLESLREFNCRYQLYLQLLKPQNYEGEFCDDYLSLSPVFERACEMGDIDSTSETAWDDLENDTPTELTFTNRIAIDQPIFGNYLLNSYYGDTVGFSSGLHPVALFDNQIWMTAGPGMDNNSRKYKIYIQNPVHGEWYPIETYYGGTRMFDAPNQFSRTPLALDWEKIPDSFRDLRVPDTEFTFDGVRLMFVPEDLNRSSWGGPDEKVVDMPDGEGTGGWRIEELALMADGTESYHLLAFELEPYTIDVPFGVVDYDDWASGTSEFVHTGVPIRDYVGDPGDSTFSTAVENWLHFRPAGDGESHEFIWNNFRNLWER